MKRILLTFILVQLFGVLNAQVAINTDGSSPNSNAMLDVKSSNKGLLIPRLTTKQRTGLGAYAGQAGKGMMVYDIDLLELYVWDGSVWVPTSSYWRKINNFVYVTTDSVGIGTNSPAAKLDVRGRISISNTGESVFVGENAGADDDFVDGENVGIGTGALQLNTQANGLVAVGYQALQNNGNQAGCANSSIENTAVGYKSLNNNAAGSNNTALGFSTLLNSNSSANTAIGSVSMLSNTSGNSNTAIGAGSLKNNLTGSDNVAIGCCSMANSTGGNNNVGIGLHALDKNQSGNNNVAIGEYCLFNNTTGLNNIAIGQALSQNTQGGENIAMGFSSMSFNTAGNFNIAFGPYSLGYNDSGQYNIALGYDALRVGVANNYSNNIAIGHRALYTASSNTNIAIGDHALTSTGGHSYLIAIGDSSLKNTGASNLAIGSKALGTSGAGEGNLAVGHQSLRLNQWGNSNEAIGQEALYNNQGGDYNLGLGHQSLYSNANGDNNVAIGYQAGYSTVLSGNVFIGYKAGYNETGSNKLYIANSSTSTPLIGGNFATSQVDINGTIKITGGNPAVGKVLTSDANGLASWEAPVGDINGLSDGINDTYSLFLGSNSGTNDDQTLNYNTGVGNGALSQNTSGDKNTAIGNGASYHATTASNNISVGYSALADNVSGNQNTAIGSGAGKSALGTGNVFLGYHAGYNETGSNKLYIANSNTALPLIGGNFSTSQVNINGTLKITGGNPGVNKILTSDANGLASWQNAPIGADGSIDTHSDVDVTTTAPSNGQFLSWDGSNWVPANDNNTTYTAGTGLNLSGNTFSLNSGIDNLSDVDVTTTAPTNGQFLSWNGSNWIPANDNNTTYTAGTGLALIGTSFWLNSGIDNLTDVDVSTTTPTNGQVLAWNGSNWIPANGGAQNINDLSDGKTYNESIFLGNLAGNNNTTGNHNTGVGFYALLSNTTDSANSAFGEASLIFMNSGNFNTALGYGAAAFSSNGSQLTNLGSSVFIGCMTKAANASNDTNEVVIGSYAIGLGSNTVNLGNDGVEMTALHGKVGIGTTIPDSSLAVSGGVEVTGGVKVNGVIQVNDNVQINGGVQVANDAATASAAKVGTLRYRSDSNNSYVEMCVQTGASTYAWVVIHQETW